MASEHLVSPILAGFDLNILVPPLLAYLDPCLYIGILFLYHGQGRNAKEIVLRASHELLFTAEELYNAFIHNLDLELLSALLIPQRAIT